MSVLSEDGAAHVRLGCGVGLCHSRDDLVRAPTCYTLNRAFTRGQRVTKQSMHEFVASLHELPEDARAELLALTPMNYVGLAPQLARGVASRG